VLYQAYRMLIPFQLPDNVVSPELVTIISAPAKVKRATVIRTKNKNAFRAEGKALLRRVFFDLRNEIVLRFISFLLLKSG
jgi:hypothetical protein